MELHHDNRVFFEPVSHSYTLDGDKLLMGVTELMKKHNLGADYSGIPEATLKKAAEEGTAIHRELQDYENGETVFASELIDEYKKLGLRFIEAEYPVTDYELIASAIDIVYEGSKPGKVILVDVKTTSEYHRRALEWQLGIYRDRFEAMNPGIEVEGCYCLWIDKKARRIKGFIPVDAVSKEEVEALLDAERNGLIYVDENDVPSADLVLPSDQLSAYVANAERIAELKAAIKEIEAQMAENDKKVIEYMESHGLDKMSAPGGVFALKKAYSQTRVDSAKLQKDFPAVYAKVTKTTSVKSSVSFKPGK